MSQQNKIGQKPIILYGDVIDSRSIIDRDLFSAKLENTFKFINEEFDQFLMARMQSVKGIDEFECILKNLDGLSKIIQLLTEELFPKKLRFVILQGDVNLRDSGNEDVHWADGKVFNEISPTM